MANWLINLNHAFLIEIWLNCRKNGRAAIGWKQWTESEMVEAGSISAFKKASGCLKRMRKGDRIVAFLKDRRLGAWGTVSGPYDESVFEPQLRPGGKDPDFGRVIPVRWEDSGNPPAGQAARMRAEDVHGFTVLSSVQPISDEAFGRIKGIIADKSRWEPLAELSEENGSDDAAVEEEAEEWFAPIRESALRKILANDLSKLEPGLKPYDSKAGPEEVVAGDAGRIDLLCKDARGNIVVVELKRDTSSDKVIGQLARYIGYVKQNLANGKLVRGIIVSHEADEKLKLAMVAIPNVELKLYDVTVTMRSSDRAKRK